MKHLDPLNRVDLNSTYMLWAISNSYTYRYFNPEKNAYFSEPESDNFIEYCGLSMILRKHSVFHIEKN